MRIQRYFALGLAWLSLAPYALSQPPGQDARALAAASGSGHRPGSLHGSHSGGMGSGAGGSVR